MEYEVEVDSRQDVSLYFLRRFHLVLILILLLTLLILLRRINIVEVNGCDDIETWTTSSTTRATRQQEVQEGLSAIFDRKRQDVRYRSI